MGPKKQDALCKVGWMDGWMLDEKKMRWRREAGGRSFEETGPQHRPCVVSNVELERAESGKEMRCAQGKQRRREVGRRQEDVVMVMSETTLLQKPPVLKWKVPLKPESDPSPAQHNTKHGK